MGFTGSAEGVVPFLVQQRTRLLSVWLMVLNEVPSPLCTGVFHQVLLLGTFLFFFPFHDERCPFVLPNRSG